MTKSHEATSESDPARSGGAADPLPSSLSNFGAILSIADSVPVMIAFCDTGQVYRFCNRPLADWFERPRDRILGKSLREVMGEAAYDSRREAIEKALGGEHQWLTAAFDHPTRGALTTQAEYIPHRDESGAVVGVVMVVRDVTEERHDEERLRRRVEEKSAELAASEARFRAMFDTVRASMILLDPAGNIIDVNATGGPWRDGRGLPPLGTPLWEAPSVRDEHRDAIREMIAIAASGGTETREFEVHLSAKTRLVLECDMRPILEGDEVRYLLFEVRDVSELKSAQDQLRQAQKMEALGQLTGGLAHDFNNLLTVVVGGLDFVVKGATDERMLRYARAAQSAAERGARLTAQLLAFSRVQRMAVAPTLINRSIDEARPFIRNVLNPGIRNVVKLLDEDVYVLADSTQLEVALLNLAINARDAMPDGGSLTISLNRVRLENDEELSDGDYVEILVADSGTGMSEEVMARIFEPFFTTKDVGKGTGLGLSMVYGMAHQSGGAVRIESTPGKGTRVRLFLRVADDALLLDDKVPVAAAAQVERSASLLVIDDDDDVRAFIVNTLEEAGHRVREASSGEHGIALFDEEPAELVVLDYLMPGMTGAEVASVLIERDDALPILFISGFHDTHKVRELRPDVPVLAKPFRGDVLLSSIAALLPVQQG